MNQANTHQALNSEEQQWLTELCPSPLLLGLLSPSCRSLPLGLILSGRPFTSAVRRSGSSTTTWSSWWTVCGTPRCSIQARTSSWERSCFSRATFHSTGWASTSSTTPPSWVMLLNFTRGWVCPFLSWFVSCKGSWMRPCVIRTNKYLYIVEHLLQSWCLSSNYKRDWFIIMQPVCTVWLIDLQARQGDKCPINVSFIEDALIEKDISLLMVAAWDIIFIVFNNTRPFFGS